MASDFFISYTRADRAWAEWIAWQLEANGYTTTMQAWDFRPGRDWVHEMQVATKPPHRTIAVLSSDYFGSEHGEAEWRVAYASDPTGEGGLLVPVRVSDCEPPGLLKTRVFIDLVGLDEMTAQTALLEGVRERRAKPTLEPAFPGRESPRFPRTETTARSASDPSVPVRTVERAHLQRLLEIHERNVRILEEKEARYAGDMPVHLVGQLEDERAAVTELNRRLRLGDGE